MAIRERQRRILELSTHVFQDTDALRHAWEHIKHLKEPIKTIQRDLRSLVKRGDINIVGMVMAGQREKKCYGKKPISQLFVKHELMVTRALMKLNKLTADRFNNVNDLVRPDAEWPGWMLEMDMGTESKGKLKGRIESLQETDSKVLWVLPSAKRMHEVGSLCKSIAERCYLTNLRYITERWVDGHGQQIKALPV